MKKNKLFNLVLAAVFAALIYVATFVVQIPIPATGGYINLGDAFVLAGAIILGPVYGAAAAGIGSALADLLSGYAVYAPATFIIKAGMAVCVALLFKALRDKTKLALPLAAVVGELIMVGGYFVYESVILGYGLGAAAAIPANLIQGAAGAVVGVLLSQLRRALPQERKAKTEDDHAA